MGDGEGKRKREAIWAKNNALMFYNKRSETVMERLAWERGKKQLFFKCSNSCPDPDVR